MEDVVVNVLIVVLIDQSFASLTSSCCSCSDTIFPSYILTEKCRKRYGLLRRIFENSSFFAPRSTNFKKLCLVSWLACFGPVLAAKVGRILAPVDCHKLNSLPPILGWRDGPMPHTKERRCYPCFWLIAFSRQYDII
jgi:hypothetical protein